MTKYDHMLIDGRNAIYRAIYAGLSDKNFTSSGLDSVVIFFRFVSSYLTKFRSKQVHFFWDAPKNTLWRKAILPEYKDGRDKTHGGKYGDVVDIDALLERNTNIVMELVLACNAMNFGCPKQEADDLIYAFCKYHAGSNIIIISSDGDFKQIPFMFKGIDLYNPLAGDRKNKLYKPDNLDPVKVKAFSGEKSDNISGYVQIGPVRAKRLVTEQGFREKHFDTYGRKIFIRNMALIDLSLCPFVLKNIAYIVRIMSKSRHYDEKKIREIIQKYKVKGLSGEISRSLLPFKFLGG
jgi:5'-3' exonuclease